MLIRRKKESRRIFFVLILFTLIALPNLQFLANFNQGKRNYLPDTYNDKELDKASISSALDLSDYITGIGDTQDVRIYANNESVNLNDNQEYFEIPSLAYDDMYLTYGAFDFTFENNFTTDHVLEDDDALHISKFISFDLNESYSNITLGPGTEKVKELNFNYLVDGSNSSKIGLNATNGVLNFTVTANFTDTTYTSIVIDGKVRFNRSNILGLLLSLLCELSDDANLTVQVKEISQSTWNTVINAIPINHSLGIQEIRKRLVNENLNYIDLKNSSHIRILFERADLAPFNASFYNFDLRSTLAFDLPITDTKYVALEFDLRGAKSTVNGFYAWIRTLDTVEAATSQLNITLYRANRTVVRDEDGNNLRTIDLGPDESQLIDSILVDYTDDKLSFFKFNTSNTRNLNLSNYFIVIKSNNSKQVYSLVALPYYDYGDDLITEHQLKTTHNDGERWINAQKVVEHKDKYESGQLDASSFKINVTRGYMPSDFNITGMSTLNIQNISMEDLEIKTFPYNESSYLTWGLGRWNHNFSTPIEDNAANQFQVYLTWNKSIIKGFKFNVTYSVNAYWVENASASYSVTYDDDPEWTLNYGLDNYSQKFDNWTFLEFWYIYPNFMNAHNLTNPNSEQILSQTSGETILNENPSNYKIIVYGSVANLNGTYSLTLTSFNFVHRMHSYINYKGTLWKTNGFMYGDNISVSVEIQDDDLKAPKIGNANVSLFYPNGTRFPNANLMSSIGKILGSDLFYDFNNQTILDLSTDVNVFGEYHLGYFWFNGSAIGCKKTTIYIDAYDIELNGCNYSSSLKKNILNGEVKNKVFNNYTLLIASVNETTVFSRPNFYPINIDDVNEEFSHEIGHQQLPVLLKTFKQSESILNPNEVVNFRTTIQNMHSFISLNVKIDVKLVSYANEEWIIANKTSNTVVLNFSGHPADSSEFSVNLTIPTLNNATKIWKGVNAPIRLAGAKAIITVFIENNDVGTYECNEYSLLGNETNNIFDGHILALRITETTTSRNILNVFERDDCLYIPDNTTFLANIFDQNFVSSYEQFTNEFSLKLNSIFTNITINPNNPVKGQAFNISSNLTTEFGEELSGKNITCQYFNNNSWTNIGWELTDIDGYTTFPINTIGIKFEGDLLVQLSWNGDSINGVSKNVSVNIIHEENNISISFKKNDVQIYQNSATTFTITLNNYGASHLKITNISIEINNYLEYSIVEADYIALDRLESGESTYLIIEISIPEIKRLTISINITAQNILTNENITVSANGYFIVHELPIFDYFIEYFIYIMITIFVIAWIVALIYSRKTMKRIEAPIEEPVKKKPRRRRYVLPSELKKPVPVKKIPKKKEEPKEVKEKKKMDLDSLLEERGLAEKKKKSKK